MLSYDSTVDVDCFVSRMSDLRRILLELRFRSCLLGFYTSVVQQGQGKCCVELARLFFIWLLQVFVLAVAGGKFCWARKPCFFCFASGLRSCVLELRFWGLLLGFRKFLLERREGKCVIC